MLLVINLPLVGLWVKMLRIRYTILYPTILVVSLIGIYSVDYSTFDVFLTALFGLLGYLLQRWRCEAAPLVLAVVLGPMMEEYFRRAMLVARGDAGIFVSRPLSLGLLVIILALLASILAPNVRRFRSNAFQE